MKNLRLKCKVHNFPKNKGFTLVEVIVVLVILAILAAILVPKLTGWIDESMGKTAMGEAHMVLSAMQAVASEEYANGTLPAIVSSVKEEFPDGETFLEKINDYLDGDIVLMPTTVNGETPNSINDTIKIYDFGEIRWFTYTASNMKVVNYDIALGGFTVE